MRTLGEVIYVYPDEVYIIVVMVNQQGVRYIDPDNLEFDEDGYIKTRYATHETINEWAYTSHGTIGKLVEVFRLVTQRFRDKSQ